MPTGFLRSGMRKSLGFLTAAWVLGLTACPGESADCGVNETELDGTCVARCNSAVDCTQGRQCEDGLCRPRSPASSGSSSASRSASASSTSPSTSPQRPGSLHPRGPAPAVCPRGPRPHRPTAAGRRLTRPAAAFRARRPRHPWNRRQHARRPVRFRPPSVRLLRFPRRQVRPLHPGLQAAAPRPRCARKPATRFKPRGMTTGCSPHDRR